MKPFILTLMLATHGVMVQAAGTIAFANGPLSLMRWGCTVPFPVVYGVFWGTNQNELSLALPLGSNSTVTAGLIVAPSIYAIQGTEAGQTVYMQIKAWSAAYGTNWVEAQLNRSVLGQTHVAQVTLAPDAGPGAVIWQGTGTNPNRFYPLILLTPATVQIGFTTLVDEGNQGTVDVIVGLTRFSTQYQFPVTSNSLNFTSTVLLSTTNMTAIAGEDYVPTNVLVTFGPGQAYQSVAIKVTGDALPEPNEQFGIKLTAGSSVCIESPMLVVTIREARVASVRREADHAMVSIATTSRQRYALEFSPDLVSWSVVPGADNIAGTGGIVQVRDSSGACCDARFYRTRLLP